MSCSANAGPPIPGNDYQRFFPQWHKRDLVAMVHRDRNHPCVNMWSIGNEILEQADEDPADSGRILDVYLNASYQKWGAGNTDYNREHSWPQSWFGGDVPPMNSDLFQLYPTDNYVTDLHPPDFAVYEDGIRQELLHSLDLPGVALDEDERHVAGAAVVPEGQPEVAALRGNPRHVDHDGRRGIVAQCAERGGPHAVVVLDRVTPAEDLRGWQ